MYDGYSSGLELHFLSPVWPCSIIPTFSCSSFTRVPVSAVKSRTILNITYILTHRKNKKDDFYIKKICFSGLFLSSWIRIQPIKINSDPDPQHSYLYIIELLQEFQSLAKLFLTCIFCLCTVILIVLPLSKQNCVNYTDMLSERSKPVSESTQAKSSGSFRIRILNTAFPPDFIC